MFTAELLKNGIVEKIECPGCFDHCKVSLKTDPTGRACVMIKKYMELFAQRVKEMTVFEDDVWVVTFPKSGTTWTQEMVWLINNDLDYESALKINLNDRFPFLELNGVLNKFYGDLHLPRERPRHIKSHLPIFLLPTDLFTVNPKIVYVARNPKDVATSFYHHYTHIVGYEGSREDFITAFLEDQVIYAPFNEHVLDFWKIRHRPNILFLFYEDMKRDMPQEIAKVAQFFGKSFRKDEIERLCEHLSVDAMRKNPSCNNDKLVESAKILNGKSKSSCAAFQFIRKGEVGTFKDEAFDERVIKRFESLMTSAPEIWSPKAVNK